MVLQALALHALSAYFGVLSATLDVAYSHKINTQSACLRQLIMEVVHFTSHKVSLLFDHGLELHEKA
jgi:hypothetical protein